MQKAAPKQPTLESASQQPAVLHALSKLLPETQFPEPWRPIKACYGLLRAPKHETGRQLRRPRQFDARIPAPWMRPASPSAACRAKPQSRPDFIWKCPKVLVVLSKVLGAPLKGLI